MNPEQLSKNFVEGKCVKKLKRTFEFSFPPEICPKICVLSHKDLADNKQTFVDEGDLPRGSVIVLSGKDIDYLVGLAPSVRNSDCSAADERNAVFEQREAAYKALLNKVWAENLAFKLNEVSFVPVSILSKHLPGMFGTPIEERKDILLKLSLSEKTSLESIRKDLNLKMSVVTTTSNNLEMFVGVRVDMIESLATALIAKKRGGDMEARIDLPAVFVDHILLPSLKLTTEFRPVNDLSSLSAGNYSQLVCRMVGNVKGLKKLGIHASKHPKWKNPFVTVEFISEADAEIAP